MKSCILFGFLLLYSCREGQGESATSLHPGWGTVQVPHWYLLIPDGKVLSPVLERGEFWLPTEPLLLLPRQRDMGSLFTAPYTASTDTLVGAALLPLSSSECSYPLLTIRKHHIQGKMKQSWNTMTYQKECIRITQFSK